MEKLITIKEVAARCDLTMTRCYQLARERGFPEPVEILGTIKLFDRRAIEQWIKAREAKIKAKRKRAA